MATALLYPGVFPNLEGLDKAKPKRADLEAILLTGIPPGVVAGFQNYTGSTQADMLRLNLAVPPASNPSVMGLLGGDAIYDVADPSTLTPSNLGSTMDVVIQSSFAYLGDPRDGFDDPASTGALVN